MSHHPYTLEYMRKGETLSNLNDDDCKAHQDTCNTQHDIIAEESRINPGPSTSIRRSMSDAEAGHTRSAGEDLDALEQIKEELNITIRDDERVSFLKILRMALGRRLKIFAEEATIVGLSHLVTPSNYMIGSIVRKVVWTMLLLFGIGFMVFQICDRISFYLSYPTTVVYHVAYNQSLRFPTVTICPEFYLSRKAILSLDMVGGVETKTYATWSFPPFSDMNFGDDHAEHNFSQLNFDRDFLYNYLSMDMKDLILDCSFGNLPCNVIDAIQNINTDLGDCFSFNADASNYVTTVAGANYGFRLVLWLNQSDGYIIMSPSAGYRVSLHAPFERPIMHEAGFKVGSGISTSISLSLRNVSMLPSPYGDCRQGGNYTMMGCSMTCLGASFVDRCNCRPLFTDGKLCSPDLYYNCLASVKRWFVASGASVKCGCPLQCYQPTYPYSISTSPLSQHFLNYVSQKSQFKGRNLTMSKLNKELVYLDIFYSQLSYVDIQTTPAYDFLTLICDIGGALGLILGGTLLTIAEFSQFLIQLFDELLTSARFARLQRR